MDLSLTGSAIVLLPADWSPGDWRGIGWERFAEEGKLRGQARPSAIAKAVVSFVRKVEGEEPPTVFVEQHSFGAKSNSVFDRAELVGAVKHELYTRFGIGVVPIVASHARKVLLGKLPRMTSKEVKAVIKIDLAKMGCELPDEDSRDAFICANAGRHELGLTCLAAG